MDAAVLIVTYNSAEDIAACLHSVFAQRRQISQQVIVVDNASTDDTVKLVREQFPEVELLTPGKNLGFAAGVNLAARHAQADYLLLLNPDAVLLDHAADVIVGFARANPRHGLYGGRIVNADGSTDPMSCWGQPTLWSLASFACGLSTLFPRSQFFDPESLGRWQRDTVREVGVITGCFLLAERQVWEKLGGFDERYFMYGEDVDLARRALDLGCRPVLCPDAKLAHEWGKSSGTPAHKMLLLYRGKASLVRFHWTGWRRRLGLLFLSLGVGLRSALSQVSALSRSRKTPDRWAAIWRQRREWLNGYEAPAGASPQK